MGRGYGYDKEGNIVTRIHHKVKPMSKTAPPLALPRDSITTSVTAKLVKLGGQRRTAI